MHPEAIRVNLHGVSTMAAILALCNSPKVQTGGAQVFRAPKP